jgi:hypothetical protein
LTAAAVDGSGGDDVFATTVNDNARMVADRPSLPPPPPPPLMLPPPRPCPCLIAAAFTNVIAPPMLLSMVCVVCRPLPAALSAVQICQSLPSCGALSTLFPLGRRPLSLTIASRCLSLV